jgi:hypothetical protein
VTPPLTGGFGNGVWGNCPWGNCYYPTLNLVSALAIAENVIQVTFNAPIYWSGILDADDGSIPAKYLVTPIAGGVGLDGSPVRPVNVVGVSIDPLSAAQNVTVVDITLDRPMTPFPAEYSVTLSGIWSADQTQIINPAANGYYVPAAFKMVVPPALGEVAPVRDFANPQTLSGALDPLPVPQNPLNLGVFGVDDTGDYAFDQGLTSYKKRILRRLFTVPNAFIFLPGYGVGLGAHGKKLARPALLQQLASSAESQISLEPETESVTVQALSDLSNPGLVRFLVNAVPKAVNKPVRLAVNVPLA